MNYFAIAKDECKMPRHENLVGLVTRILTQARLFTPDFEIYLKA